MFNDTKRLVTIGVLSALGTVLMLIEIPYFIPFLKIDLSDVVVLVVFLYYGWKEAALVGVLKALVKLLIKPAEAPIFGLGEMTAFIASMSLVLGMYLSVYKFKLNRILSAVVTILSLTLILTVANYFFITPMWFGATSVFELEDWSYLTTFFKDFKGGYLEVILIIYVPFNIIKGIILMITLFSLDKSIGLFNNKID